MLGVGLGEGSADIQHAAVVTACLNMTPLTEGMGVGVFSKS